MVSINRTGAVNNMQIKKAESKKKKGVFLASTAAATGSSVIQTAMGLPVAGVALKTMISSNKKLNPDQINQIMASAEKFITSRGLSEKGVVIENVKSAGFNLPGALGKVMEYIHPIASVAAGNNAAFINKPIEIGLGNILYNKNSILINKDKLPTAVFHEIGHAINYNNSKFWKFMQGIRMPGIALAMGLALFGAYTNNAEAKDGQELTKGQKAKNAVRNNAGKLAFAAMMPMLLEEGMASIRGCKWANSNLPKELAKKVLKTNIGGYVSYLGTAITLGVAAFSAVKLKDHFASKFQAKNN